MSARRSWALGAILAFLLGACSQAPTTSGAPSATAEIAQKLTVALPLEPATLDNLRDSSNPTRNTVAVNIIEPLAFMDSQTRQLQPNLATGWSQIEPTVWRITLRSGVKFHDGSTMSADDVVASLKYTMVKGSAVWEALLQRFSDIRKVDAATVDIVTKSAEPLLPIQLQFVGIAPASAVSQGVQSMSTKPVGSGPYKFVQWSKGTSIVLTRFDDYWGGKAPIKDVEIVFRKEASVRADMVRTGEAQLSKDLRGGDLKGLPKLERVSSLSVYTWFLNSTGVAQGSLMQDVRLRQAVNFAIDRPGIRDKIYGGFASSTNGNLVPALVLGHDSSLTDYPYDPAKAKSLVEAAGATGKTLTAFCSGGRRINDTELCQVIASQLSAAGFKVDMQNPPFDQWLAVYRNKSGNHPDMMLGGPTNETYDFASVTGSTLLSLQLGGGDLMIADPRLDQIILAATKETDLGKREALSKQASRIVYDQAYAAPVLAPDSIWGAAANLEWKPRSDDYMLLKNARYVAK